MKCSLKIELTITFHDGDQLKETFTGAVFADRYEHLPKAICNKFTSFASQDPDFAMFDKDVNEKSVAHALSGMALVDRYLLMDSFSHSENSIVMNIYIKQDALLRLPE